MSRIPHFIIHPPIIISLLFICIQCAAGRHGTALLTNRPTTYSVHEDASNVLAGSLRRLASKSIMKDPFQSQAVLGRKLLDSKSGQQALKAQKTMIQSNFQGAPAAPAQNQQQPGPARAPSIATSVVTAQPTNPTVLGSGGIHVHTSTPTSVSNPISVLSPSGSASGGLGRPGILSGLLAGTAGGVAGGLAGGVLAGPLPIPFGRR